MISEKARQDFLETIPVFAGLHAAALSEIGCAVEEFAYKAGDLIVREGEPGDRLFLIQAGKVEVVIHLGRPQETTLAVLGPGAFVGEMSLIECVTRCASLQAVEETFLFALKGTDLYHLFQRHPDQYAIMILNLARDLCRRLRTMDERFSAISH